MAGHRPHHQPSHYPTFGLLDSVTANLETGEKHPASKADPDDGRVDAVPRFFGALGFLD